MTTIQHIAAYKKPLDAFDVVVVGSGPSGATVARTLAEQGKAVLILEFGGLPSPGAALTPHQATFTKAVTYTEQMDGNPWTACCVGGGMQFYSAITFRYRAADLRASQFLESDMAIDWPIEIQELNEHYAYIEALLGIEHMGDYPLSARATRIAAAMSSLGYHPHPMPLAILPPQHPHGCGYCAACDSRCCPMGTKASVITRSVINDDGLPGSITVLYGCLVKRILQESEGQASGVECYIPFSSQRLRIPVAKVVCCSNAIQSSALLLRSRSSFAPRGIGNEHDLVGRGLSLKVSGYSIGSNRRWLKEADLAAPHRGAPATVYTDDFYQSPDMPTHFGGLIYEVASPVPEENIGHLRIHNLAGDEPWSHNRITLEDKEDEFGMPILRFQYRNTANDEARLAYLTARADEILREAGAVTIRHDRPMHRKGASNLHGTARAGVDPTLSVVDPLGKVHGYDNVYVMDASVMNFASNWNPTHTIMANARRMALALR